MTGLVYERDEILGLMLGGIDDEIFLTGGLGGGDDSSEMAESSDLDVNRLRDDSLADGCDCGLIELLLKDDKRIN